MIPSIKRLKVFKCGHIAIDLDKVTHFVFHEGGNFSSGGYTLACVEVFFIGGASDKFYENESDYEELKQFCFGQPEEEPE